MTREEAIQKIRTMSLPKETMEILEALAPEITENNDERIRKDIINLIYWLKGNPSLCSQYYKDRYDGMLAWLEKQKESSITANDLDEEIHRFFNDCIDVHEAKLYGNINERVIPVDCYEITARHFAKWAEKQKDNKFAPRVLPCSAAWFEDGEENEEEQKTVEWSDEDERMLSRCIKSIETSKQFADSSTFKVAKDKEIEWLKNLSLNLKKKNDDVTKLCSNEWSEEDEEILNLLILNIGRYLYFGGMSSERILSWLKSIRPHWKPSEEQMSTLAVVIDEYYHACTKGSDDKSKTLKTLFEQLKKL